MTWCLQASILEEELEPVCSIIVAGLFYPEKYYITVMLYMFCESACGVCTMAGTVM